MIYVYRLAIKESISSMLRPLHEGTAKSANLGPGGVAFRTMHPTRRKQFRSLQSLLQLYQWLDDHGFASGSNESGATGTYIDNIG